MIVLFVCFKGIRKNNSLKNDADGITVAEAQTDFCERPF